MHVVIVGAGEVGWYLASRLRGENHDVVVVEQDEVIARALGEELDVQTITGNGASPSVLEAAGAGWADLVAGVTQNDEVNLIASLLAKELGARQTVVRIQNHELRGPAGDHLLRAVGADLVIDPDADTADEILELVHVSGADEVYPMSAGDLVVLGAVIGPGSMMAGRKLADIGASLPSWGFLVGALTRDGDTIIPRGDQELLVGDHVRMITKRSDRRTTLEQLGAAGRRVKRVMVLGGGAVGSRVADHLQGEGADVVLVERDPARARALSERLRKVTIVEGDITDTVLLVEEAVARMDVVIAATGEDTSNVLACAFAAGQGDDTFTVAVLHRLALLPLVRQFGIDAALSPRTASANAVLRHLRGGHGAVATFLESDIEVNEFTVEQGSRADGATVRDLHLPRTLLLGATVRADGSTELVRGNTVLAAGDNVVVFLRPTALADVRRVFGG